VNEQRFLDDEDPLGFQFLPFEQITARPSDLMDLSGRTAVVTGAGGHGLGQAIAHRLAAQGAKVAVVDIEFGGAERVVAEIAERWGVEAVAWAADVSDWDLAHQLADDINRAFGSIDIWINNVGGIGVVAKPFAEQTREEIDVVFRSTFTSTLYATHAVLQVMIPRHRGRIINISSEGSKMAQENVSIYSSSKSGIDGFTRNLGMELPEHGVSIVAVNPGYMMSEGYRYAFEHPEEFPNVRPLLLAPFHRVSIRRSCLPEEAANFIAFLASDAGAYAHGSALSFGGGMSE
jgi:3-oxoacyl-[acyl-carrier protein] reductase